MKRSYLLVGFAFAVTSALCRGADVNLSFSTIGDAGNAGNTILTSDGTSGYGSVSYVFKISTYEVTQSQYTSFLNAVDPTGANSLGLFMNFQPLGSEPFYGVRLNSGAAAGSKYSVLSGYENKPIVDVTFYDAVRFANWLNNGQGSASTETGAYTLLGGTATPTNGEAFTRNVGAQVWIPSENEWTKAAYYDPTKAGSNKYWLYPTHSDTAPTNPNGSTTNTNAANFYNGVYATTQSGGRDSISYLTDVNAYSATASHYGVADMAGNVREWNDNFYGPNGDRLDRGSTWDSTSSTMRASERHRDFGNTSDTMTGFRVATVPEPGGGILFLAGAIVVGCRRRRLVAFDAAPPSMKRPGHWTHLQR